MAERPGGGYLLLDLLTLLGWKVIVRKGPLGVRVDATHAHIDPVSGDGASVADIAADLYWAALYGPRPLPTKGA